jgi:tryptophan synthase alpha chain
MAAGTILIERLPDGSFRATAPNFPHLEATAASADDARRALEEAVGRHVHRQLAAALNPVDALFDRLRSEGRKAFLPFVTAGDPDLGATALLVRELARRGASLVEVGFPYSDPIADGPVIQASYTRALERGLRLDDVFACLRQLAASPELAGRGVPLVAMASYSLIHRRGPERFLQQAREAGLAGAIVPDLPVEEAAALAGLAAERDFKLVQLVTPTTPRDRAAAIARQSSGFLYCVSVAGITGERDRLPPELLDQLQWLRTQTSLPLCVGFGIGKPEHVHLLRDVADGVIVGSALVRRMEQAGRRPVEEVVREVGDLAESLARALEEPVL